MEVDNFMMDYPMQHSVMHYSTYDCIYYIIMPPILKKLQEYIGFRLSVHPSITCMPYLMNHAC